jgi:hypothetical protein
MLDRIDKRGELGQEHEVVRYKFRGRQRKEKGSGG